MDHDNFVFFQVVDVNEADRVAFANLVPENMLTDENLQFLGLVDEDQGACGVLCYSLENSVIEVKYIAVYPELQRQKGATLLLVEIMLRSATSQKHYPISVLFPKDPLFEDLHGLLQSIPEFVISEEEGLYCITPQMRAASAAYQKLVAYKSSVQKFQNMTKEQKNSFLERLDEMQMSYVKELKDVKDLTDLGYVEELCLCTTSQGQISTAVFVRQMDEKDLELAFMYAQEDAGALLGKLTAALIHQIEVHYADYNIYINAVNPATEKMIKNLFGEALQGDGLYNAICFV